jgi:hypothetical protein
LLLLLLMLPLTLASLLERLHVLAILKSLMVDKNTYPGDKHAGRCTTR